jgi:hypothetical protein
MGTLVTLDLPDDSPAHDLAWIITFGPDDEAEDWEAVVCGPYERAAALALAEAVVMDEDLMAVVEPLLPHVSVDDIRGEITAAKLSVDVSDYDEDEEAEDGEYEEEEGEEEEEAEDAEDDQAEHDHEPAGEPPTPDEIRAGFRRIAARLNTPVT